MAFKLRDIIDYFRGRDKPTVAELGAPGTIFFAGKLSEEEYNPDLQGEKAIAVYERMRKSDGQVKAALLACELPLRAAHWDIEAASDSEQDQEIADIIRHNLFDEMTITWDAFLRHIMLMLPFGFSVFEKVWEIRDGMYKWRKFAPRLPKTITKWDVDKEGGLLGIQQRAWKVDPTTQVSTVSDIDIPVEKLLVFTNDREGSNFQGVSLLRAAYKHWYYKDQLYRIDGIAAERHGVGLAVFKYPSAAPKEDKDKISEIGERLHAHERAYIALPEEISFDLKGVAGQLHDIKGSIEHHDLQIVRSILAQFINLGSGEVGSYALSQDQSGFFLMALQALSRNICDTFNRYALRQMVDFNWDVKQYPHLAVSGLEYYDIAKYSKALTDLVNAGILLPDRNIEAEMRRLLHLPAIRAPETKATEVRFTEWQPRRYLRGAEQHVAFKDIKDKLDTAEDKFVKAAKEVQAKQIKDVVSKVAEAIEKGDIEAAAKIDIPHHSHMAKAIEEVLLDLYDYGQEQVKQEIGKQRGGIKGQEELEPVATGKPEVAKAFLKTRAKTTATILGTKLRAAMAWEALHQIKEGKINRALLTAALTSLSDKELKATAKFTVSEALNLGREQQAKEMADDIERVIYSAILDENTCGACAAKDGTEYKYPSAEWDEVAPPYKHCEGEDRCRCLGVYVYKSERPAIE